MLVETKKLTEVLSRLLVDLGLDLVEAKAVLKEYVYAETIGRRTHGFALFSKLTFSKIKKKQKPFKVLSEEDTHALIDGRGGLGQVVASAAMEMAVEKAMSRGIAVVGVRRMESYLMPGYYARKAALKGLVGLVANNTSPSVAPVGGVEKLLGTNPLGIAVPTDGPPLVIDMATSAKSLGHVSAARNAGAKLAPGIAIDNEGFAATDPAAVAALLPFGSYKGFGLSLLIELLTGALVGARISEEVRTGLDRGYVFIALDPSIFTDPKSFKGTVSRFLERLRGSDVGSSSHPVRIPGVRDAPKFHGEQYPTEIDLEASVLAELTAACRDHYGEDRFDLLAQCKVPD